MASNTIGVGIIGLSAHDCWAARAHVPALKALPGFEIRALAASSQESAAAAAQKYGVPHFFDSAGALARQPEVDIAVVAVRVPHHLELVSAVLQAGKPVYCEWPLGNGLAEAEEMVALAKASGTKTFIGLQARSSPVVRYVRDIVASGELGEVISTTLVASPGAWGATVEPRLIYGLDRANGVSMLTIQFGHAIDGLCWCLGEFKELSATLATRYPNPTRTDTGEPVAKTIDDQIAITGILENGAVASIHYRAGSSRAHNFFWEINGSKGDLVITGDFGRLQYGAFRIQQALGDEMTLTDLPIPPHYERAPAGQLKDIHYTLAQAYAGVGHDLMDGGNEIPTFEDALVRHRMIDAIERSAATGARQSY